MAKILVVDDDHELSLMIREVLEKDGHHVTTVHTGQDGVRTFTREPFDLVIQDVNLPGGVSGYGACQTYKSVRDTVAVIMMTGEFKSDQDEALARRLGADGFLRKPYTQEQLLREVGQGLKVRAELIGEAPVFTCRGCGARFTVRDPVPHEGTFPLSCPNCGAVAQVTAQDLTWEKPEERKGPQGPEARGILVVEDSEAFRQFLVLLLTRAGHVVLEAKNGKEGLDFCQQWKPQLVIADLMLPEMDGITMCKQIRENPQTAKAPIMILTAFQSEASRQQAKEMGATYLTKPVKPEILLEAVAQMLTN
ncbi:MAG: response regulator [Candidatus Methylomirabilales bacterium]